MIDEIAWLESRRPEVQPPSATARDAASAQLGSAISRELGAPPSRRISTRRRWRTSMLVPAIGLIVAIAVAVVALTSIRRHPTPTPTASRQPAAGRLDAVQSRQQLIQLIGVLRRPQTNSDLNPSVIAEANSFAKRVPGAGPPDLPLVRYAMTTSWGQPLYIVPFRAHLVTGNFVVSYHPLRVKRETIMEPETLGIASPQAKGLPPGLISIVPTLAKMIESGQDGISEQFGRQLYGGGMSEVRFIYVVPDGVARVTFLLARDPVPGYPFEQVYEHTLSVSVPVHNNVVAVQVDRQFDRSGPAMIWYAADGEVIKRVGDFRNLNRAVPEPLPGPETVLSRAAEKNPSTPNPIWVTPVLGGPHTAFRFHFKVLLNDAYYTTQLSGPRCPGQHLYGLNPGQTTLADNLRGHIYNSRITISARTTWCPGTYRLAVTLISEAFDHPFKPSAHPFGTATFTVRP